MALLGCEDTEPLGAGHGPGSGGTSACDLGVPLPDGACVIAGVPADGCGDGFLPDGKQGCEPVLPTQDCPDGTMPMIGKTECQVVGVPVGMGLVCGAGFQDDGHGGCNAILPTVDCATGTMAVPGETQCHEPQECGVGTWGDIPVAANTQRVDASYTGGGSDGSVEKPWTTISDGLNHAASGAVVAVAAGNYPENLTITRGVQLWGVCPSRVSVTGGDSTLATLAVSTLPAGEAAEIHGLGLTGPADGIDVFGASGVTLAGLWVHDTGGESLGIHVTNDGGPSAVVLNDSLIEGVHGAGVLFEGTAASVERIVIRDTRPRASDGTRGAGLVTADLAGVPGTLTLRASVLDKNRVLGLDVVGSTATVEGTVIRATQALQSDMTAGYGIALLDQAGIRGNLTLTGSLLEQNRSVGLVVIGSDATVNETIVRDTQPQSSDSTGGFGIVIQDDAGVRSSLTMGSSLVERNTAGGLIVAGSDANVDGTLVRDTQVGAADMLGGDGIDVVNDAAQRGKLTLTSSVVNGNHTRGLAVNGGDVTIVSTIIRNSLPNPLPVPTGYGITVFSVEDEPSTLSIAGSLLDNNQNIALYMMGGEVSVQSSVIRNTQPSADMTLGRGIDVENSTSQRAKLTLSGSLLTRNHDIGLTVLGAEAIVDSTVVRDTQPRASDGDAGLGIVAGYYTEQRATLTLTRSLLDQNRVMGLQVTGADATVGGTVFRGTLPSSSTQKGGQGIEVVHVMMSSLQRGTLSLSSSLLEDNREAGLVIVNSDAMVDSTVIRNMLAPADGEPGRRLGIQVDGVDDQRSTLTLTSSFFDQNYEAGLEVQGSDATVTGVEFQDTHPTTDNQSFGDGLSATLANVTVENSLVQKSARASVSNFGSNITLRRVSALCSPILFDEEVQSTDPQGLTLITPVNGSYTPEKAECFACDGSTLTCKAVSKHLAPPTPLPPLESTQ